MSGNAVGESRGSAAGRHKRPFIVAFALSATYMLVEAVAGLLLNSLALLSDAGHMLTDVAGLGMALAAIHFAESTGRDPSRTYGLYRLEVLAALANSFLLLAVAVYVLFEAYGRLMEPSAVPGAPLIVVAAGGLLVNLISFRLLKAGAKESLNVRGAFLEVVSDLLGSLGVIVAGVILLTVGWGWVDPVIGALIGLFILPRAARLGRDALRVLLEVAPKEMDIGRIRERLAGLKGVASVHDLHVWTLTSGLQMASAHLRLAEGADCGSVVPEAASLLEREFQISHATLQCDPRGFIEADQQV
ncbi:MAG: cation diffusion facilitator family transporter [Thermoleophilia bacterium]